MGARISRTAAPSLRSQPPLRALDVTDDDFGPALWLRPRRDLFKAFVTGRLADESGGSTSFSSEAALRAAIEACLCADRPTDSAFKLSTLRELALDQSRLSSRLRYRRPLSQRPPAWASVS